MRTRSELEELRRVILAGKKCPSSHGLKDMNYCGSYGGARGCNDCINESVDREINSMLTVDIGTVEAEFKSLSVDISRFVTSEDAQGRLQSRIKNAIGRLRAIAEQNDKHNKSLG